MLGNRVLIGMHATVLNHARIADDSIVAASALIPEGIQIPPSHLVMGIPGRIVRPITEAERSRILDSSEHYLATARRYVGVLMWLAASKQEQRKGARHGDEGSD